MLQSLSKKKFVDETTLVRCCWLLLPAVITYMICVFYLRTFPLWSYIVEGVFTVSFLVASTIVCVKQKNYLTLVKIYFSVITLAITLYLMSEVPKWMMK